MPNGQRRRVLVTDGDQRASLAVVRSLGAAGHLVGVCATRPHSLAAASRFTASEHIVTSALTDPAGFVDDVHHVCDQNRIDTLIPMTEPALLALLPQWERFHDVLIPFPSARSFIAISDKQAVLQAAQRAGIAVPAQTILSIPSDFDALDLSTLKFPLVVKPARSVSTGSGNRLKLSVQHAASQGELRAIITDMDARAYPLLLQQRILGPGIGIFVLLWNSELIAQFAHRRIREKPPSGGISVYRESVVVDPALLKSSLALLAEFDWRGVAMIEYKLDEATGTPYLMEINGRFWGSLQLAVDAGVDFPRLLLEAAAGENPRAVTRFRTDVRSRWFWGDVDHLVTRLLHSDSHLALPPGSPSRARAIADFFTRHPHDVSEIRQRGDTKPFYRESLQWFRQIVGK